VEELRIFKCCCRRDVCCYLLEGSTCHCFGDIFEHDDRYVDSINRNNKKVVREAAYKKMIREISMLLGFQERKL